MRRRILCPIYRLLDLAPFHSLSIYFPFSSLIEIGDGFSSSLKPIRPAVIDEDKCTDEPSREYQVRLQPTISAAGTYTVTCKVDKEVSAMSVEGGSLEVISSGSAITGYHPTSIPTGENVTIVIKVSSL